MIHRKWIWISNGTHIIYTLYKLDYHRLSFATKFVVMHLGILALLDHASQIWMLSDGISDNRTLYGNRGRWYNMSRCLKTQSSAMHWQSWEECVDYRNIKICLHGCSVHQLLSFSHCKWTKRINKINKIKAFETKLNVVAYSATIWPLENFHGGWGA